MRSKSDFDFLFAQPSIASGAARLLDLAALFDRYNTSSDSYEDDCKALLADWQAVGDDIRSALDVFAKSE